MKYVRLMRRVPEVILIGLCMLLVPVLPRRAVVGLASFLGRMTVRFSRKLRRLGMANLESALGSALSEEGRLAVLEESCSAFALVLLDLFWFAVWRKRRILGYVKPDAGFIEDFKRGPVVAVTGHFGNWELMGQAGALHGVRLASVASPLANPIATWFLNWLRRGTGQEIVARQGAVKRLLRILREGGVVALLLDQNTLPEEGGAFFDFFGLKATVSLAGGSLATRTGARIVPAFCVPGRDGTYRLFAGEAILPTVGRTAEEMTQAVTLALEQEIRRRPGLWLWMYKRWKYRPQAEAAGRYPYYTKPLSG